MSDTQRCEPPEHMRGVDGWHWVQEPVGDPHLAHWHAAERDDVEPLWTSTHHVYPGTPRYAVREWGWRYIAPVTPPSTVAALVEALEAADQFIRNGIELGYIRMPSPSTPDPALETPDKVANALALYRGEVA